MHELLFQLIAEKYPLSDADRQRCLTYFEPVSVPKNQFIETAGKPPAYLYFISSGYVRLFYTDESGTEVTTHINCPPGFITSYNSFISQTASRENVASVTACQLLRITKANLDQLFRESTTLKDFSISVFEQSLAYNETRANELATLTAEQRYKKLMQSNPGMLQQVPVQYIASFLGMKPESLSRIRRQLIS